MEKKDINKNPLDRGFSLIEILIAVTIIMVMATAFIPLFVYVTEASQANKARLVATKLASNEIEYIRSLSYPDVGTVGGNPEGLVERTKQITINGITYSVITDIWWVDDLSDNVGGSDPIPYDYKRVRVSVSSPSIFSAEITQTLDINTLTALEGGEEAFPGGNIRANVIRGWNTYEENIPVSNAGISLTSGPDAPQSLATDEFGTTLFAIIAEGEYIVYVNPTPLGMMAKDLDYDISVVDGITTEVIFELEYPCHIELEMMDNVTGNRIDVGGSVLFKDPIFGDKQLDFTGSDNGYLDKNFFGDLWPIGEGSVGTPYGIEVYANGYLKSVVETDLWDGQFTAPGELKVITIELDPINAIIEVRSSVDDSPIVGATVKVYQLIHTFNGEGWQDETILVETLTTDITGKVSLALDDNTEIPETPATGDTYSPYYSLEVEATDFLPTSLIENAFTIDNGIMKINDLTAEAYVVSLETSVTNGSIRVRAERNNGSPRNNVRIRVMGPGGYDQEKKTNSGGVAGISIFDNLASGTYYVYRRAGSSWSNQRTVTVVAGAEVYVVYTY